MDFRLPSLGEGIDSATVVAVKVKPGDAVSAGQEIAEVETDKANMPVTADVAGTVSSIAIRPGDKLTVGELMLTLSGSPLPQGQKEPTTPLPTLNPSPQEESKANPHLEFRLPPLGEGIDGGTVVAVKVKPGDTITVGQEILEVETDKAAMPVASDMAGQVDDVRVKAGDKVSVGTVIAVLAGTPSLANGAKPQAAPKPQAASPPPTTGTRSASEGGSVGIRSANDEVRTIVNGRKDLTPAGPATRRLARELGVALRDISGSGRGGRVTLDDVKGYVRNERQQVKTGGGAAFSGSVVNAFTLPPLPDFSKFGEIEKKPVAKIRETIAKNLTIAWRTMPMVTQNDLADITELEAGRKRIVETQPKGTPKITWTVLAVKACVAALKEFPHFNASYDMNASELVLKKYFHIGIAVDTERGLVVPVIKDADKKSIRDIATEVQTLADKARSGKLAIDEMRGGTFTITNLGGIGGTSFTPIVNYPEVAILGMSRSALQPVIKDGQIVPRLMLPLSLTYDHRVIDGADGARFTSRLVQLFSDPMRLLLES
jgi:pyruvate dehydrogenase E2 component (dihydrolipoamide acetyltransferase)